MFDLLRCLEKYLQVYVDHDPVLSFSVAAWNEPSIVIEMKKRFDGSNGGSGLQMMKRIEFQSTTSRLLPCVEIEPSRQY